MLPAAARSFGRAIKGSEEAVRTLSTWGRNSGCLERLPVTQEAAGSSPVAPANIRSLVRPFWSAKRDSLRSSLPSWRLPAEAGKRNPTGQSRVPITNPTEALWR